MPGICCRMGDLDAPQGHLPKEKVGMWWGGGPDLDNVGKQWQANRLLVYKVRMPLTWVATISVCCRIYAPSSHKIWMLLTSCLRLGTMPILA